MLSLSYQRFPRLALGHWTWLGGARGQFAYGNRRANEFLTRMGWLGSGIGERLSPISYRPVNTIQRFSPSVGSAGHFENRG
jgi:hypothetical protein